MAPVLAPGGRIIVIDALHFATPTTLRARLRHVRGRIFWTAQDRLERARRRLRQGPREPLTSRYRTDTGQPPGICWQSVADARRHFTEAGMGEVTQGWLDTGADVDRRTASLRWRIAGRLPRFFTLAWAQQRALPAGPGEAS